MGGLQKWNDEGKKEKCLWEINELTSRRAVKKFKFERYLTLIHLGGDSPSIQRVSCSNPSNSETELFPISSLLRRKETSPVKIFNL